MFSYSFPGFLISRLFVKVIVIVLIVAGLSRCARPATSLPAGDPGNGGLILPGNFEAVVVVGCKSCFYGRYNINYPRHPEAKEKNKQISPSSVCYFRSKTKAVPDGFRYIEGRFQQTPNATDFRGTKTAEGLTE